jgi:U3 small nucleolar RNA-associated protein 10
MVIASTSADAQVRVIGVQKILNALSEPGGLDGSELVSFSPSVCLLATNGSHQGSMHFALLARLHDTDDQVVSAVYTQPHIILTIVETHQSEYLSVLENVFAKNGATTSRHIIRFHLLFLAHHFSKVVSPVVRDNIFQKFFFPFLLFSRPRQKTAKAVWNILGSEEAQAEGGIGRHELISGCVDIVNWEEIGAKRSKKSRPNSTSISSDFDGVEVMCKINMSIASKIAGAYTTLLS